jgi:hypothetical protein
MLYLAIVLFIIFLLICWKNYCDHVFRKGVKNNEYIVIEKYYHQNKYSGSEDYYITTRCMSSLKTKTISVSLYEYGQNTIGHALKLGACK